MTAATDMSSIPGATPIARKTPKATFDLVFRNASFGAALLVEEALEAGAGADPHMMITLGAHFEIALQFCPVEHLFASGTLGPHPFRNVVTTRCSDLALGKDLLKPAHGIP